MGRLKGVAKSLEDYSTEELIAAGIVVGQQCKLEFESGIQLRAEVSNITKKGAKLLLISFKDCTVTEASGTVLFQPEWGMYDMAIGDRIVSVFNGAADKDAYEEITYVIQKQTHQIQYDAAMQQLHQLYQEVRTIRESDKGHERLEAIFNNLKIAYSDDWLCGLEILEILDHKQTNPELEASVRAWLVEKAENEPEHRKLIVDGLHVIANPVTQLIIQE